MFLVKYNSNLFVLQSRAPNGDSNEVGDLLFNERCFTITLNNYQYNKLLAEYNLSDIDELFFINLSNIYRFVWYLNC